MEQLMFAVIEGFPTFVGLLIAVLVLRAWVSQLLQNQADLMERLEELSHVLDDCVEKLSE